MVKKINILVLFIAQFLSVTFGYTQNKIDTIAIHAIQECVSRVEGSLLAKKNGCFSPVFYVKIIDYNKSQQTLEFVTMCSHFYQYIDSAAARFTIKSSSLSIVIDSTNLNLFNFEKVISTHVKFGLCRYYVSYPVDCFYFDLNAFRRNVIEELSPTYYFKVNLIPDENETYSVHSVWYYFYEEVPVNLKLNNFDKWWRLSYYYSNEKETTPHDSENIINYPVSKKEYDNALKILAPWNIDKIKKVGIITYKPIVKYEVNFNVMHWSQYAVTD